MKKNNVIILLAIVPLSFASACFAFDDQGLTVTKVGQDGNGTKVIVTFVPNENTCNLSQVSFEGPQMNMTLSIALAAKMASKTVQINYIKDSDEYCYGSAIFAE